MDTNKGCSGVTDVITERVGAVPDANMRSTDRMFNTSGKQAERGTRGEDAGSAYGQAAVAVETQINSPDSNMRTNDRKFKIADVEGALGLRAARGACRLWRLAGPGSANTHASGVASLDGGVHAYTRGARELRVYRGHRGTGRCAGVRPLRRGGALCAAVAAAPCPREHSHVGPRRHWQPPTAHLC